MRILVMNCGSSTLKFQLFEFKTPGATGQDRPLATGMIDRVGGSGTVRFKADEGHETRANVQTQDFARAAEQAVQLLRAADLWGPTGPDAVGHRVVHGGSRFNSAVVIDDDVIAAIEAAGELAPLHNRGALAAIRATRGLLAPAVPMTAVFDTAFHRTLPERAARYAIPFELADLHHVRRYGFHGIAHRYMSRRCARLLGKPSERTRLITLQLGNGCSAAAIEAGRSVDTSMGFSPLEGLVMGTRSGDIDPAVVSYLCRREKVEPSEVEEWLNRQSGLLGVSGASPDMRELLSLEQAGSERATLAVECSATGPANT